MRLEGLKMDAEAVRRVTSWWNNGRPEYSTCLVSVMKGDQLTNAGDVPNLGAKVEWNMYQLEVCEGCHTSSWEIPVSGKNLIGLHCDGTLGTGGWGICMLEDVRAIRNEGKELRIAGFVYRGPKDVRAESREISFSVLPEPEVRVKVKSSPFHEERRTTPVDFTGCWAVPASVIHTTVRQATLEDWL